MMAQALRCGQLIQPMIAIVEPRFRNLPEFRYDGLQANRRAHSPPYRRLKIGAATTISWR
ncbi:MAG: hypothetical protein WCF44_21495 [Candidatus Methylophosphatis roskildensis]